MRDHKQGDLKDYSKAVDEWSTSGQWWRTATALFQTMKIAGSPKVLDVGCNQGALHDVLRAFNPAARYHGVDYNPEAIQLGLEKAPHRQLCAFDGVTIKERNVGHVVCIHTLPHTAYPAELLKSMRDTLQPGGKLGMLVANPRHDKWLALDNLLSGYKGDPTIRQMWSETQLHDLVYAAGFRNIVITYVGRKAYSFLGDNTRQWFQLIAERL